MRYITKLKLATVHQLCDAEDKSTEYMFQFMQDTCNVDLEVCINYMKLGQETHLQLFKEVIQMAELFETLDN